MARTKKKLTPEQNAFLLGRQFQAKVDAVAVGKAVKSGKIVVKRK